MVGWFSKRAEEPQPQQGVEELTAGERDWLASLLEGLARLELADDPDRLSDFFDAQRAAWFAAPDDARADPNTIINLVGAGVGQLLVARCGLRWAIVTDEYGSELSVVGQPGDIVVMPMNAVGKRWADGPRGEIAALVAGVVEHVSTIRAAGA